MQFQVSIQRNIFGSSINKKPKTDANPLSYLHSFLETFIWQSKMKWSERPRQLLKRFLSKSDCIRGATISLEKDIVTAP